MGLAGATLLGVSPGMGFERLLVQLVLIGLALGLYDTLVSTVVAERFRERAVRPMSAVHSAATLGAMLGPPLAAWLAAGGGWAASFHAAGFAISRSAPPARDRATGSDRNTERRQDRCAAPAGLLAALLPFALAGFAYVGIESR
jgi:MFS family permease